MDRELKTIDSALAWKTIAKKVVMNFIDRIKKKYAIYRRKNKLLLLFQEMVEELILQPKFSGVVMFYLGRM